MNNETFMVFLKANHPYLYDIEMRVRKVQDQTGFGDVSATITLLGNKVISCQLVDVVKTKYNTV